MARTPKPLIVGATPPAPTVVSGSPFPTQFDTNSLTQPPAATNGIVPAAPQGRQIVLTVEEIEKRGSGAQASIAAASKTILSSNKTGDLDELGDLLTNASLVSKGYDPDNVSKGFFGFFKNMKKAVAKARTQFETAEKTIDGLVAEMNRRIALYDGQVRTLDTIRAALEQQHIDLGPEIEYIEEGIAWMEANVPPVDPTNTLSAQKVQDWHSVIAAARTRVANLRNARALAETMVAQTSIMKTNAKSLSTTFLEFQQTTLPTLRTTFSLWIMNKEQEAGIKLHQTNREMANQAMLKNAELLGRNTTLIHTEANKATFDNSTVTAQYDAVINSLNEIERIRIEAKAENERNRPVLEAKSKELAERLARAPTI